MEEERWRREMERDRKRWRERDGGIYGEREMERESEMEEVRWREENCIIS